MFEFLFRIVPSSVFPALFGAAVWIGASYFYLTPEVYQRATKAMVSEFRGQILEFGTFHDLTVSRIDAQSYARCVYDEVAKDEDFQMDFAVWVATIGHYGRPRLKDMKPILDQVIESKRCGMQPWTINRHATLTLYRRAKLTPLNSIFPTTAPGAAKRSAAA